MSPTPASQGQGNGGLWHKDRDAVTYSDGKSESW
jgi:hypothetical protein